MLISLQLEAVVKTALLEDLAQGDVLSEAVEALLAAEGQHPPRVEAVVATREACVVSGLNVALEACRQVDATFLHCQPLVQEGDAVTAGTPLLRLTGSLTSVQRVERTLLNFLQLLCGTATHTRRFVDALDGLPCRIAHTRKTIPCLRLLQQQAVKHGGGYCHRYNLGSTAMFKDTLIQSLPQFKTSISLQQLANQVQRFLPHTAKLEIEADTLALVQDALDAHAEVILLDNMTLDEIRSAVAMVAGRAVLEVSGGITLENVRHYAQSGVDVISTSQLTLAAPPIDIGLDILHP